MEVIVDGEKYPLTITSKSKMGDLLAEIDTGLRAHGKAILAVNVDGASVPPDQLQEVLGSKKPSDISELEIRSATIVSLVKESLGELKEILPELPSACEALAQLFHSETPSEGFEKFEQLAAIWQEVKRQEARIASALDLELETLMLGDSTVAQKDQELNKFLEEVADAIAAQDTVLIGDLLQYELAPRAEVEASIVDLLSSLLEERRP